MFIPPSMTVSWKTSQDFLIAETFVSIVTNIKNVCQTMLVLLREKRYWLFVQSHIVGRWAWSLLYLLSIYPGNFTWSFQKTIRNKEQKNPVCHLWSCNFSLLLMNPCCLVHLKASWWPAVLDKIVQLKYSCSYWYGMTVHNEEPLNQPSHFWLPQRVWTGGTQSGMPHLTKTFRFCETCFPISVKILEKLDKKYVLISSHGLPELWLAAPCEQEPGHALFKEKSKHKLQNWAKLYPKKWTASDSPLIKAPKRVCLCTPARLPMQPAISSKRSTLSLIVSEFKLQIGSSLCLWA